MKNIIKQQKKNTTVTNNVSFDIDYITGLEPGIYLVLDTVVFASNASGRRVAGLTKNYISPREYAQTGDDYDFINTVRAVSGAKTKLSVCGIFEIETRKDRIHSIIYQSSGDDLKCLSSILTVVKLDK